ncbi:hypothetical protein ACFY3U_03855 [Micromonospora sp. NPDC000089]|uniref:hypothetical protein n=1 Tax=unclassified Micromonospora TaxID=2617518 RepID=UPI0036C45057
MPTDDSTWFDWAALVLDTTATLAAIAALGLAVFAINLTRRQGERADSALIRERRAAFELQVHRDLLDSIATATGSDMRMSKLRQIAQVRLAMLPPSELPVWRAYAHSRMHGDGKDRLAMELAKVGAVNETKTGYDPLFWGLLEDLRLALERRGQPTAAVR